MPNIGQVLRDEIMRLARKEVRAQVEALRQQVRGLRETVKGQQAILQKVEKALDKMVDQSSSGARASLYAPAPADEATRLRVTPASVRRHRLRLNLSQAELGQLLGVSTNSIVRWEAGTSHPRAQHRTALVRLRDLKARDVGRMLE
ncbi:MAG: helix-turn-helix domain-containing protein [Gemmatimonadota bacterium]